jgi:hypothetical protein
MAEPEHQVKDLLVELETQVRQYMAVVVEAVLVR